MADARQKRHAEQQDLLNGIKQDTLKHIDELAYDHDAFFQILSIYLMKEVLAERLRATDHVVPPYLNVALELGAQHVKEHAEAVRKKIAAFSRTQEEEQNVLGQFLLRIVYAGVTEINNAYLWQELHEPQLLYEEEGRAAADEVPLASG